jgi:hypothetical protein
MHFNKHSELANLHAFLSPSSYHWINYDEEKLEKKWLTDQAAARGSRLHDLAHKLIKEGVKLPQTSATLNQYVNDCIGWRLRPEQTLFYSVNCFGHADAIGFNEETKVLRVSDLKTGITPTSEHQLEVYMALFCLEYGHRPFDIVGELRIYQNDEVRLYDADPGVIVHIMDRIVTFHNRIEEMKREVLL